MSTTTDLGHPRQLRLPGQTAAPDGPVDMTIMYVMHHAFRRDLAAFAMAVRPGRMIILRITNVPDSDRPSC